MNRREFMKRSAVVAAGTAVAGTGLGGLFTLTGCDDKATGKGKVVGLQLYSLREAMGQDVPGTLKTVSQIGYKSLETAGYGDGKLYGYAPKEFKKMCEDLGMEVTSAHVGQEYSAERDAEVMAFWDKALDAQLEAGCTYAIQPWFPIGETIESVKVYCDYFNKVGEMAKGKGIKFGFHNHAGEFEQRDGQVILDYMIANTDPAKVLYELDVYWAVKGGVDPVDYINKYKDRISVLHIKDESIIGESGMMDFEPIFDALYQNGHKDYYVEVEQYTLPPVNCVQRSYDYLMVSPFVK